MDYPNRIKCACCGYYTIYDIFQICEVCFWQDCGYQQEHIDDTGGPNAISLRQAIENYKEYGVTELRFKKLVRLPKANEL